MPGRKIPRLSPREVARIVKLRADASWLGLRRLARALGVSVHTLRTALFDPPPRRLRAYKKCANGHRVRYWPCPICRARSLKKTRPV